MIRFHIEGYDGDSLYYYSSMPVDIIVFAENLQEAKTKAECIVGHKISNLHFRYKAEELLPLPPKEGE